MSDWEILGQSFANVAQFTVSGILIGGLYALVALGIVVINKASGVFNFAHGWMMFIGGLFFWQFYQGHPSDQMAGIFGVLSAFLIVSTILSMGLSTRSLRNIFRSDAPVPAEIDENLEAEESLDKFLYRNRLLFGLLAGIILWIVLFYLFTQDAEPILRGTVGAVVGSILVGLLIERFTIRPLLGQPVLAAILMTLAVGFILQGTIQIIWGEQPRAIDIFKEPARPNMILIAPGVYQQVGTTGGGTLPAYKLETASWLGKDIRLERSLTWGFGISILTFAAFTLLFQYTSIGLAMRATAEDQVLAESVGLRVRLILAVAWGLVAIMAGIAGSIQGTAASLSITSVPFIALLVFPAVLLGGLESITGALVGGLIIGVVQKLASLYISDKAGVEMAPYVVLMIVLLFRPEGLFGQRRIDRV